MNQLSGKYVNVVLSVEGGRGMDFLKNAVHITGNFNNRILESDKIPASERPQFNTELVWEVDKKELRKIRSANQPLRVECITTDSQSRRDRVGFTLLSLRSAHIIALKNANQEITPKWHKLIGCQTDKKQCHPEIYLSLTVRDHLLNEAEATRSNEAMPYISEEDIHIIDEPISSDFPVAYLENGYIQVGDDESAVSTFSLNLFVKDVVNLDALLPEIHVFQQNKEKYFLSFRIMGVAIKTKPFRIELHNTITLNEKVVVKMLSGQDIMAEFFKTQNITINFCCGQDKLGTTNLDLDNISTMKESKCFFKFPSLNGIIPFGGNEKAPFITVQAWLEHHPDCLERTQAESEEEKPKPKTFFSNIPKFPSCGGDEISGSYVLDKLEKTDIKAQSDNEPVKEEPVSTPLITKSVDTIIKNVPLSPRHGNPLDIYQKYVLEVSLKSLMWKKSPKEKKIIFKFLHPKAASYITVYTETDICLGEKINLINLDFKIIYISSSEKVQNLLNAWPPKLVLMDEKEKSLNEEHEFTIVLMNNYSAEQDVVLKAARTLEPLAKLTVYLNLNEFGMQEPDTKTNSILFPAVLDEVISVKEITDIDKWKATEKELFEDEMEKIKGIEMKKLRMEWDVKRTKMEEQLNKSIERCKKLQEGLQAKVDAFKTEKGLGKKRSRCGIYEEIFNENWKTYSNDNTKELIEILSKTQRDNDQLKEMVSEQRKKLEAVQKSTLTKSQTANLLQELRGLEEKFETARSAKSYFKDQWQRACEEIHDLKREEIINRQTQIKQNKDELSQLSLDKFENSHDNEGSDMCILPTMRSDRSERFYF